MPLASGSSRSVISHNISEMERSGHPHNQAIAASLENARRHPKAYAKGGVVDITLSSLPDPSQIITPTQDQTAQLMQQFIPKSMPYAPPIGTPPVVPPQPTGIPPQKPTTPLYGGFKKGGAAKMANGGFPSSMEADPWYMRQEDHSILHPEGLVQGRAGGRTDVHPIQVPAGSYVLPADVVSGLAEGNTMAGSNVIDRMMHSGPYGINMGGGRHGPGAPRAPHAPAFKEPPEKLEARGGPSSNHQGGLVPIIVAGGEHIIYPQSIIKKFGNLDKGHKILDAFVLKTRKNTVEDMKKLKGPKK